MSAIIRIDINWVHAIKLLGAATTEGTMEYPERRVGKRYVIQIPLNFRELKSSSSTKEFGEIIDVSNLGVAFSTTAPITTGTMVEVFLRMPLDVLGRPSSEWQWIGKVTRCRPYNASKVWKVVGVQFCCFQTTEEAERLKNRQLEKTQVGDETTTASRDESK
jgi:hypothetical protein